LTGPIALTGEKMVRGAKFALEEAGYEVAGRKIEVIVEDSGGSPAIAVDKAKRTPQQIKTLTEIEDEQNG